MSCTQSLPEPPDSTAQLRRLLRHRRRQLSAFQQQQAAFALARHLRSLPRLRHCVHIAAYWAMDGEINPAPFIRSLKDGSQQVYLPLLHPFLPGRLIFAPKPGSISAWKKNRFQIPEPQLKGQRGRDWRDPWALDAVLMPLVGFDRLGHRLGMGGGFYDRTFAAESWRFRRPCLIGVAHDCQEVEQLSAQPWDVPLDALVTPSGWLDFASHRRAGRFSQS